MPDILNPNENNQLSLQQGREIPKINLAPSTFDPGSGGGLNDNPPAVPTSTITPQDTAPLLEQVSGGVMPTGNPVVSTKVNDDVTPDTPQATEAQIAEAQAANNALVSEEELEVVATRPNQPPTSEVFGTTPSFDIQQGTPVDTDVYFQSNPDPTIPFDAPYSGRMTATQTDINLQNTLERNKGLTPQEIENRNMENLFAGMGGQQIQNQGIFQSSKEDTAEAYIPQPGNFQWLSSGEPEGIAADLEENQTRLVADHLGRQQLEVQGIKDRPFDYYVPQFDNSGLFTGLPTSEELRGAMQQSFVQVVPPQAPSTQGVNATDNALVEAFGNLLGNEAQRGGVAARRRGQDGTIISNVTRTLFGGAKNLIETAAGLGASIGVGLQTIGRTAVNLVEGEGTRALPNAFRESLNSGQGRIATRTYRDWTENMPTGDTAIRGQQTFNPLQGQFGDYGSGTLGGVFYAMDLPANLLLSGVYTAADALDYDKRLGGQDYTGNRFADAFRGRDQSFTQRRDNISYLSPVTRDDNKGTGTALGQWGSAFVLDVLTGNVSDAVVGVVARTGRESVQNARRFASNSLPNFTSNPPAPTASVANPTGASSIVTPPGANRARLTTPNTIYENPNMAPAVPPVSASAPINPLPNALQQLDPRLNLRANYQNLQNNAYITPPSNIFEPSPANSLEAVNSNTQLIAQQLANHNRRNANQAVVGIPNSTVPNAPVVSVPVTTPTELIQRAEQTRSLQRQVAVTRPGSIVVAPARVEAPVVPSQLADPQTAARFIQNAIDDGAVTVDPTTNTLNLTPEVFAERAAKQNDLSNTRESLVEVLQRPLTPEVKARAEAQLVRIDNELAALGNDIPASQQTIDVVATVIDEGNTPALDVPAAPVRNMTEEELFRRAGEMLDDEISRLEESLKERGIDPNSPINWDSVDKVQVERIVSLAEEARVPVQQALEASGLPPVPRQTLEQFIGRELQPPTPQPRIVPEPGKSVLEDAVLTPEEALRLAQEDDITSIVDDVASDVPNPDDYDFQSSLIDPDEARKADIDPEETRTPDPEPEAAKPASTQDDMVNEILAARREGRRTNIKKPPARQPQPRPISEVTWTRSPLDKKGAVYDVDMDVLDNAWKMKGGQEYVGAGGRNGIGDRYEGIGRHLSKNGELTMPTIDVDQDGYITFVDGRHRTAYARDNGLAKMPVFVRNPGAVKGRPGWTRRGKVGVPVTPAQVDELIPVVKQTDISAPVSPVEVQKVSRQASAKRTPAPPIDPAEVKVVKRTNVQLSAIARNTIDPDSGLPIWTAKRPMTTKELDEAAGKYGDLLSRYGKEVNTQALDAPVKRIEVEKAQASTGKARKTKISETPQPTNAEPPARSIPEQIDGIKKEIATLESDIKSTLDPRKELQMYTRIEKLKEKITRLKKIAREQGVPTTKPKTTTPRAPKAEKVPARRTMGATLYEGVAPTSSEFIPLDSLDNLSREALEAERIRVKDIWKYAARNDFPSAANENKMRNMTEYLAELKERIDDFETVDEFLSVAPVTQKLPDHVPTTPVIKKLQQAAAKTEAEMVRMGEEAKRLEQQLVDMEPAIRADKDEFAELAHAARQDIENEFTTREWSGLIDPMDNPNRLRLERPDISGGVNKNSQPVSPAQEQARNLGIKNANASTLDEVASLANNLALQNGVNAWDLKNELNLKDLIQEAVEKVNAGETVNTTSAYFPVVVSPDGLAASKSMDEIYDYLVTRGFNYEELGLLDEIDIQAMYETAVAYPRRPIEELTGIKGFEDLEDVPNISTEVLMSLEPLEALPVKSTSKVPTSLNDLQTRISRLSTSRQKDAVELLQYVDLPNAKLTTMDEWLSVEAESSRIWDIASQYDQADTIEIDGIKPFAVERMARFAPGSSATRAVLNAPVGGLTDDMVLKTVGGENPVGRASLFAQEWKHGSYVAPEVRKWSRMLGETVWAKATPEQRVKILQQLGADELEGIGVVFKAPMETTKVPVEGVVVNKANELELRVSATRAKLQQQAAEVNAVTFYHGSKADVDDLTVLNPKQGSSFGELGSGIYLTNSPSDAEHYAKAFIPENKYPTGDVRTSAVGKVHEVKVKVAAPLDGNLPVPKEIASKLNRYLKEVHPDIDYRVGSKTKTSTVLLKIRQASQDLSGRVPVSEARMVEIQRVFTDIVQSEGYDSIIKVNRDGTLTASVFNGANLKVSRQTTIGDGSLAEGYFSRKYLDEYMHSQYPNFDYTRANMLKSRIEAEEFMFKETERAWKEAAVEAEDSAANLAKLQNELESVNRTATRQAADNIVTSTEDAPKKQLKKYMEDTDNLCL